MKKSLLIVFLLLLFSVQVFADQNESASRNILDLMYFPTAEKFFIMPTYNYSNITTRLKGNAKIKGENHSSNLEVGYGLTKQIAFSISESYYFKDYTRYSYNDGNKYRYKSEGFTDPDITVTYRLFENTIVCDLSLNYSPKIIKSKESSSKKKGNEGRGGHEIDGGIQIGKKINKSEFACEVSYLYFTDRRSKDAEDNTTIKTKGGNTIFASLEYQYNLVNDIAINLGFLYGYTMKERKKNDTQNLMLKYYPVKTFTIPIGIKYAIMPQQLSVEAIYAYSITNDQRFQQNSTIYRIKQYNENIFQIGLLYQF